MRGGAIMNRMQVLQAPVRAKLELARRYFGVQFYPEDLLGCPVDLVTEKALRPELRPYIEREAVNV